VNSTNSFLQERKEMVDTQLVSRGIHDKRVINAFRKVPRHLFVRKPDLENAYSDHPLPIGNGQTISQPYIVALMTSSLKLSGREKVLEVGTGSGYQTAILSCLAKEVHSIERIEPLLHFAKDNLRKAGIENIQLHLGDGSLGWQSAAPYDRILITAAAPEITKEILGQLNNNGRIVCPVGGRWRQILEVWSKGIYGIKKEKILPVVFVPLRGTHGWQD
jgi:protein-L-isoaspartate(D-aspartate) O-methyltransferase